MTDDTDNKFDLKDRVLIQLARLIAESSSGARR